ncbi:unnamed protein product [Paramecium octaurelia]|uniref:Transmembrane protein n=1 Tax=Paramecium octaurelia TaxID=43137 RepID=A0A8S1VWK6_PAROT|nr:unnamed protein product [Paramecium octaurelia]
MVVAGEAATENIEGEKFILIYRILAQIFLIAFFHVLMIKLLKIKNRLINLITLLKCICVIICWEELDIDIQNTLHQSLLQQFVIALCFVFAIESQICQTLALLFNLLYSLTRHFKFDSKSNISFAVRLTIMHVLLQIYVIISSQKNNKSYSNAQLIAMSANNNINYSQMYSNRVLSPKQAQTQFCIEISEKKNQSAIPMDQKIDDNITESIQQDHLFEVLLTSFDQGIYIIDNSFQQAQIINPLLSNLILKNEKLNLKLFEAKIVDSGISGDEIYMIIPKLHQSNDIESFLRFSQTLDSILSI